MFQAIPYLQTASAVLAASETVVSSEIQWVLRTRWDWAPWLTCLLLAAMVMLVVVCYRSEVSPARRAYRMLLGGLRLTTIALLLLMLSEAVYSGIRSGRPRLGILLDQSESMQIADARLPNEKQVHTREEAARKLLLQEDSKLIKQLAEQYDLELLLVDASLNEGGRSSDELLSQLSATSNSNSRTATRLGDAINSLMESPTGGPLQAVVALTDGQSNRGRSLEEAAESARRAGVPLYFVGIGNETPPAGLELEGLLANDRAFVDDLVRFQATLRTQGLSGQQVAIELSRNGKLVAKKTVTVPNAQETDGAVPNASLSVELLDRPPAEGEFQYTLRAVPQTSAEVRPTEASELYHTLTVREEELKVLLAAGYPNYEFRYLKHLLERDSTVQVSTVLQEADLEHADSDLTALRRFPVSAKELALYDVLVLIDLDPSLLPRLLWGNLASFVSEQGGGLVLVAGPRSMPAAYVDRPELLALLPTKPTGSILRGWNDKKGFRPQLTMLGSQSSAMLLNDTPDKSELVWNRLPPFYWVADVGPPKPSAQVLAEHPTHLAAAGKRAPLMVSQYYGAGRVLLHATDSTWRWRYKVGDVYFARYWIQTLRSLASGKQHEASTQVQLSVNEQQFDLGEAVRIELRDNRVGSERASRPLLKLTTPGKADREIELEESGAGRGRYVARLSGLPVGKYRALLIETEIAEPTRSIEFEVQAPPGEMAHTQMNRTGLTKAAQRTRGAFIPLEDADQLAELLPVGRPVPLDTLPPFEIWNRWPILLGICVCLSLEWILRKQKSML